MIGQVLREHVEIRALVQRIHVLRHHQHITGPVAFEARQRHVGGTVAAPDLDGTFGVVDGRVRVEDAQGLRLDSYWTAVAEQLPRVEIELELGKPKPQ